MLVCKNLATSGTSFGQRVQEASYVKDPDTGKRLARPNPLSEWITTEVPALRIIDNDLWSRVKARQRAVRQVSSKTRREKFNRFRRPKYLFSGLTKCARCGGGYVILWGREAGLFQRPLARYLHEPTHHHAVR